jgi:hypothetical protein
VLEAGLVEPPGRGSACFLQLSAVLAPLHPKRTVRGGDSDACS